jgi:hypothetical protein
MPNSFKDMGKSLAVCYPWSTENVLILFQQNDAQPFGDKSILSQTVVDKIPAIHRLVLCDRGPGYPQTYP